jgi:surface protein
MPSRTWASTIVGTSGSRSGAGSLHRVYNWCHTNDPDHLLACTLGTNVPSLNTFSFVWTIPGAGTLVELPLRGNIQDGLEIDWGDGDKGGASLSHTYASAGTYTVVISDSFTQFGLGYNGVRNITWKGAEYITEVISFNESLQSLTSGFFVRPSLSTKPSSLVKVPATLPASVKDLSGVFFNCRLLNDPHISYWDTSNVTTMLEMFSNCPSFNQSISNWDVSKVTNMNNMFSTNFGLNPIFNNGAAPGVSTGYLFADGKAPTSALTTTAEMFLGCPSFNQSISNWDVSAVTDMSLMFSQPFDDFSASPMIFNNGAAPGVSTGYLFADGKAPTSALTTTRQMFARCTAFNQSVSNWDVSAVKEMSFMFYYCTAFNQSVSNWDVSAVKDMSFMFVGCIVFNNGLASGDPGTGPLFANGKAPTTELKNTFGTFTNCTAFNQSVSNWDVSAVKDMSFMFVGCIVFNNGENSGESTGYLFAVGPSNGALTTTRQMFYYCAAFNQSVSNWDVSAVKDMSYMFARCTAFNQSVSNWDVSAVKEMSEMFSGGGAATPMAFNNGGGTGLMFANGKAPSNGALEKTNGMFIQCTAFNQSVSNWDVSAVKDMSNMFDGCIVFNNGENSGESTGYLFAVGPSNGALTTTRQMFARCTAFNQSVSNWDVSAVKDMSNMFDGCTAFNQSVSNWDVSAVKDMSDMFNGSGAATTMAFNNGGVTGLLFAGKAPSSELTNMRAMFVECTLFNNSLSNWDTSNVTTMRDMFVNCSAFDQPLVGPLAENWKLSTSFEPDGMENLFSGCTGLSQDNYDKTLVYWATQYTNSSPSFPTGVQLTNSPLSPTNGVFNGITDGYDILTASSPGWTIDPPPVIP